MARKHHHSKGQKSLHENYRREKKNAKKSESFKLYIYKVLKESIGGKEKKGINRKAINIMNNLVFDIFEQIGGLSA